MRHVLRLVIDLIGFGFRGGGRSAVLLVLVGAPVIVLIGVLKIAGIAALYPFL